MDWKDIPQFPQTHYEVDVEWRWLEVGRVLTFVCCDWDPIPVPGYAILDGKQRLESVRRFMRDEVSVFAGPDKPEGYRFSEFTVAPLTEQFRDLRDLEQGWLDGDGSAIEVAILNKMESALKDLPDDVKKPNPYLYPTPDGGVRCEWDIGSWKVAAVIEPDEPDILALTAINRETGTYYDHNDDLANFLRAMKDRVG